METSVETLPRPSPAFSGATGEVGRSDTVAEGFSLAERYALLADAELEEMAGRMARAEVVSSAYEGVLLDEEQLKGGLLQVLRETRLTGTSAAA